MLKIQSQSLDPHSVRSSEPEGKLLIVDDEADLLTTLDILFSPYYTVVTADSGARALEILHSGFIPHVILADQRMPGMSGTEFLAATMNIVPQTVRVVLTGYTDVQDITDSINRGNVYRFLTKPWRNADLLEIIRACFEHFHLSEEKIALMQALERVKAVSQEKSDILDIVAHDLRNPLNAIVGLSEMLENGGNLGFTSADYQQFGTEIRHSATRMSRLVRNLLNIHALESGNIAINFMPINISLIAGFIMNDYRARAEAKDLTLHSSPPIPDMVMADEVLCHQIIENLLSNAIKYSPPKKNIWLETVLKADTVCFSIKDEGPGISEADKAKMFQKFTRLSAVPTAGEDSTGLGLAIVKKFAEKMNACVRWESELGQGTTFFVEFPRLSV